MNNHMREEAKSLPSHQQLAAPDRWPVVGEHAPRRSDEEWRISVGGFVAAPRVWNIV